MKPKDQSPALLAITWPIFIELALQMLMRTTDVLMLSSVSDEAVASVGVANQLISIGVMTFQFIAMGTAIVISQYLGARQTNEIGALSGFALGINLLFGAFVSLLFVLCGKPLLTAFSLSPELMDMGLRYLTIAGGAMVIQAALSVTAAIVQTHGFTRHTMLVAVLMNVLNLTGNSLFLFGLFGIPKLGVTGVAVSTAASQLIGLAANLLILRYAVGVKLRMHQLFRWRKDHAAKVMKVGLPSAMVSLSYQGSQFVTTVFIASLGAAMLSTKIYTQNIMLLIMIFGMSMARGVQIIAGRLVGEGRQETAYGQVLRSLLLSIAVTTAGVAIVSLFRVPLLNMFTDTPDIIETGAVLLLLSFMLEPGRNFNMILEKSLQAAGDASFAMTSAILVTWLFSAPLTYVLGIHFGFGLIGIWIAFITDEWARGIVLLFRWRSKAWYRKRLAIRRMAPLYRKEEEVLRG